MAEMKVKGLKIFYSNKDLNIINSYQICNIKKMENILTDALEKADEYDTHRTMDSLINEWITHNLFYKLHLFRKHTKDCNFESEQKIIIKIICFIFSRISKIKYFIKKIKDNIKIKKQTKLYIKYIIEHKKNIEKAFEEMRENSLIFQRYDDDILGALWERVLVHDESKYSDEEFIPYRKNFFPINAEEKENNKLDFDKAWEHHWKNNSHHWQYRKNKTSFNKDNKDVHINIMKIIKIT